MDEKRKVKRRFLLYYMRVYDGSTRHQIGNLVDITPKGVMIVSEEPLAENQIMNIRIELTTDVSEKPYMEFSARSIWCETDVSPSLYNIGFEIIKILPEDKKIVQRINEVFGFRENKLTK